MPPEHDMPPLAETDEEKRSRRMQQAAVTFEMTWLKPVLRSSQFGSVTPGGQVVQRTQAERLADDTSHTHDGDDGGDGGG